MTIHARAARPPDWPKDRLRRVSPVPSCLHEGPLIEPTAGVQPRPQERVLMPLAFAISIEGAFRGWKVPGMEYSRLASLLADQSAGVRLFA